MHRGVAVYELPLRLLELLVAVVSCLMRCALQLQSAHFIVVTRVTRVFIAVALIRTDVFARTPFQLLHLTIHETGQRAGCLACRMARSRDRPRENQPYMKKSQYADICTQTVIRMHVCAH